MFSYKELELIQKAIEEKSTTEYNELSNKVAKYMTEKLENEKLLKTIDWMYEKLKNGEF